MRDEKIIREKLLIKDTIIKASKLFGCSEKEFVDTMFEIGEDNFIEMMDKPNSLEIFKKTLKKVKSKSM